MEPGSYVVTCFDAHVDKLEKSQYGDGTVLRFILELDEEEDEDGEKIQLDAIANLKLSAKSKLMAWIEAFGFHPAVGESFDTDQLVGKKAMAVIEDHQSADGGVFSRVKDLMPLPKSKGGPGKVQPSLINPDGSADWTVFWGAVKLAGKSRGDVADELGLDITDLAKHLQEMDPFDVPELLEKVTK